MIKQITGVRFSPLGQHVTISWVDTGGKRGKTFGDIGWKDIQALLVRYQNERDAARALSARVSQALHDQYVTDCNREDEE